MKTSLHILLIATITASLFTGCATQKSVADYSKVNKIQIGVTSTSEIVRWFGQPTLKRVVSAEVVKWGYALPKQMGNVRYKKGVPHILYKQKVLWISIKGNAVSKYEYEEKLSEERVVNEIRLDGDTNLLKAGHEYNGPISVHHY
jgi:hypothetical protein